MSAFRWFVYHARRYTSARFMCKLLCIDGSNQMPITSAVRNVSMSAIAGYPVILNCTLDAKCFSHTIRWARYPSPSGPPVIWYNGKTVWSRLQSDHVSVENNPTRGWSALTIPIVKPKHRGRFHCLVTNLEMCEMNFQLSVTGNSS